MCQLKNLNNAGFFPLKKILFIKNRYFTEKLTFKTQFYLDFSPYNLTEMQALWCPPMMPSLSL